MAAGSGPARGVGGVRKQRALDTRRRVVTAAYHLFCQRGYVATTMHDIAGASGVAVQTLYFTFRTKAAILEEALGAAVVGFEAWNGPPAAAPDAEALIDMLEWYPEFEAAPGPKRALQLFVEHGAAVLRRVGPLQAALVAVSALVEAGGFVELAEQRRADTFHHVAGSLARRGALQPGVDEARATDVLLAVFSVDVYQALTAGRGWTHAACEQFLLDVLAQQLLPAGQR